MLRIPAIGRRVAASQPSASDHETRMLLMRTLPDSVKRRPMESQLCANLVETALAVTPYTPNPEAGLISGQVFKLTASHPDSYSQK